MPTRPTLRPATLADASALAVLMDMAAQGMPSLLWSTLAAPAQSALEVGRDRARREEGGFSYRNAIVAELNGEVVGSLIGYRLDDPFAPGNSDDLTEEMARPILTLEAKVPGSWYIDALAAFAELRGKGVGTKLLEAAETKGREAGARTMSVIVGSWNQAAARLYARVGYAEIAREAAALPPDFPQSGDWVLMTKSL